MRLACLQHGHRLPQRLLLALIRLRSHAPPAAMVQTLLYRPAFFGRPVAAWLQRVLRGPSDWSVGERELFAAFVSSRNRCAY